MATKKALYKVAAFATTKNERDIIAIVKADSIDNALKVAHEKEPSLEKRKDVRVYTKAAPEWVRVQ